MNNTIIRDGYTITVQNPYVDEHNNPIERTKLTHPYSYDGYVLWRGGDNDEIKNTVYSDRLREWNYKKTERLNEKYNTNINSWKEKDPKKIEKFLQDYCDNPEIKLILIMEYCNQSTGYPVWRFDYGY